MKKFFAVILISLFIIVFYSCKSETTEPQPAAQHEIEYKTTGTVNNISEIRYLNYNGDTLTANNQGASWNYKWTQKGKAGDKTYLKVTLTNQTGYVVLTILSDSNELTRDTLRAYPTGVANLSRGITIP